MGNKLPLPKRDSGAKAHRGERLVCKIFIKEDGSIRTHLVDHTIGHDGLYHVLMRSAAALFNGLLTKYAQVVEGDRMIKVADNNDLRKMLGNGESN